MPLLLLLLPVVVAVLTLVAVLLLVLLLGRLLCQGLLRRLVFSHAFRCVCTCRGRFSRVCSFKLCTGDKVGLS
jgi:hypothetical protein